MLLLYIIFIVYILAVNFCGIMLVRTLRDESCERGAQSFGDGKLLLCAILGGAIAIYISMFIMRFKLKNILLMILLPVIGVLNVYFAVIAFRSGFTFFVV